MGLGPAAGAAFGPVGLAVGIGVCVIGVAIIENEKRRARERQYTEFLEACERKAQKEKKEQQKREKEKREKQSKSRTTDDEDSDECFEDEDPDRDPRRYKKPQFGCRANVRLDPCELANIYTDRVLGGTYATVTRDADGHNGSYEVHHFIPVACFRNSNFNIHRRHQPAIRMLKKHHDILHNSKNSHQARNYRGFNSHILNTEGIVNATKYEITFFNHQGILPQYTVGIVQMVKQMWDDDLIDSDDYVELLRHLIYELDNVEDSYVPKGVDNLDDFIRKLIRWIRRIINNQ